LLTHRFIYQRKRYQMHARRKCHLYCRITPLRWRFARCTRARRVSRTDTSTIWWNRKSNQDNKPMSPSFRQTCLGIFLYSAPIPFRSPPNNLNCRSLAIRMDNADPKKTHLSIATAAIISPDDPAWGLQPLDPLINRKHETAR
jgi:hypothetical protein